MNATKFAVKKIITPIINGTNGALFNIQQKKRNHSYDNTQVLYLAQFSYYS